MTGHDEFLEAFPFFATLPVQARNLVLGRAVSKTLAHKQVLARDGGECSFLPFVVTGTLRIFKGSEAGREITLYRIERGESCILSATCILNGGSFPATAEAEGETEDPSRPGEASHASTWTRTRSGAVSSSGSTPVGWRRC